MKLIAWLRNCLGTHYQVLKGAPILLTTVQGRLNSQNVTYYVEVLAFLLIQILVYFWITTLGLNVVY